MNRADNGIFRIIDVPVKMTESAENSKRGTLCRNQAIKKDRILVSKLINLLRSWLMEKTFSICFPQHCNAAITAIAERCNATISQSCNYTT
jgi:hypothetical protein